MPRFDVHEYGRYGVEYMLNVQADHMGMLETRIAIPLVKLKTYEQENQKQLKPVLSISRKKYLLMTPDMTSIDIQDLGRVVANMEDQRHIIIDSIDFLLQGF